MKLALSVLVIRALLAVPVGTAIKQPVKVTVGLVAGVPGKDPSVSAFKGISFAAPLVGDLRWRAPRPVLPWRGVRKADKFGPSCIQNIVTERKPWTYEFMTHGIDSEDCFSVNVWTAAKSAKERRPVFLYLWYHPMPGPDAARFGAFHTSEVPCVLNTL